MDFSTSVGESDGGAEWRLKAPKVGPASTSLTFAFLSTAYENRVPRLEKDDLRDSRVYAGEGATSTVFKTVLFYGEEKQGKRRGEHVAIKQKRRRGSYINPDVPLLSWIRTCYSDLRVMADRWIIPSAPNICNLLGYFWEDLDLEGTRYLSPCLVMPKAYSDLEDFFQSLSSRGMGPALRLKLKLCADICSGIESLHTRDVIHGDVKMKNILLYEHENPLRLIAKIADFTHAIFLNDEHEEPPIYTGTKPFWVPEIRAQQQGLASMGRIHDNIPLANLKFCDVFSLGMLLWTILDNGRDFHWRMKASCEAIAQNGGSFFTGAPTIILPGETLETVDSMLEVLYRLHDSVFSQCRAFLEAIPEVGNNTAVKEALDKVLLMCLAQTPQERASASDILSQLKAAQSLLNPADLQKKPDFFDAWTSLGHPASHTFDTWSLLGAPIKDARLSLKEVAYCMAQDSDPVITSLLQRQLFKEFELSASLVSKGYAERALSAFYALGFGTTSNFPEMLDHLSRAAFRGDYAANQLISRVSHIVSGAIPDHDQTSQVKQALEDEINVTLFNKLEEVEAVSSLDETYFKERVRRLKIRTGHHSRTLETQVQLKSSDMSDRTDDILHLVDIFGSKKEEHRSNPFASRVLPGSPDSGSFQRTTVPEAGFSILTTKNGPTKQTAEGQGGSSSRQVKMSSSSLVEKETKDSRHSLGFLRQFTNTFQSSPRNLWRSVGEKSQLKVPLTENENEMAIMTRNLELFNIDGNSDSQVTFYEILIGGDESLSTQNKILKQLRILHKSRGLSDINDGGYCGITPLLRACLSGQAKIVEYLLENGSSASRVDSWGISPLHWLSFFADEEVAGLAKSFVRAGGFLDLPTTHQLDIAEHCLLLPKGCTPLHFAVATRNDTVVRTLLSLGADTKCVSKFDLGRNTYQMTPLHFAISLHFHEIAGILLENETEATFKFQDPSINKHWAEDISILHLLSVPLMMSTSTAPFARWIHHGANYQTAVQKTVLAILEKFPHERQISYLQHPLTALAISPCDDPYVLRSLLESGVTVVGESDPSKPSSGLESLVAAGVKGSVLCKGSTLTMDTVLDSTHESMTRSFVLSSLDLCIKGDMDGPLISIFKHYSSYSLNLSEEETFSLLDLAVKHDSISILEILLDGSNARSNDAGKIITIPKDIYAKNAKDGLSLLHRAVKHNSIRALAFLLESNANPNVESPGIGTPLALGAPRFSSREAVLLLLRKGASIYCCAEKGEGFTVLHAAWEIPDTELKGLQQFSMSRIMVEAFPSKFPRAVLDSQDRDGRTALHVAATQADLETAKLLVELGADLSIADNTGDTPLMAAMIIAAFHVALQPENQAGGPEGPQAGQDSLNGLAWVMNNASRIEQLLLENHSPLPEVEPITGEYRFLITMAANLARTKPSKLEALKCFQRLDFKNLSKPGSPAKIMCSADEPVEFMIFNLEVGKECIRV